MNKKEIIADIKRVASKLGRAPTRDEYHRQKMGRCSEHQIKEAFGGSFAVAIDAAGLVPQDTDLSFKYAQQNEELKALRAEVVELQEGMITAQKIKEIVGSVNLKTMGEGSEWLKGSRKLDGRVNGIPTLFLSDWHFDEVVKPEQIGGMNEYGRAIAEKRFDFTINQAVNLLKNYLVKPNYEGIIVPLGGDMVSGNIHDELAETNEEVINKTIIFWSDKIVGALAHLADEFGKVFVPCVVGNHGRHHKKPRYKNQVCDNYEWIMYQIIARALAHDKRITFNISESPDCFYEVYGMRVCLTHGNQFRGGEGVGGIMVPIMRGLGKKQSREAQVDNAFQLTIMGHWHQYIHMKNLVINGSGKGYDEFAYGNNFGYEPPTQALWIHHRDRGVIFPMAVVCSGYEEKRTKKAPSLTW